MPGQSLEAGDPASSASHRLVEDLAERGNFPAVSRFLTEVLAASRSEQVSTQHLSTLILKDFSLTNAILRVVNSAYYRSSTDQQISTISRAILLLGLDTVSNIAVGLTVFERLRGGDDARELKGLTVVSLLSGLYARELAGMIHHPQPEEAFICGLMHELGRLAVAYQLPDRYRAILRTVAEERIEEGVAARAELCGLDFTDIGRALAARWNLPRQIQTSIGSDGDVPAPPTARPDTFQIAIRCAAELATIATIRSETERQCRLEALVTRYHDHLPLTRTKLEGLLARSAEQMSTLSQVLHISRRDVEQAAPGILAPPRNPEANAVPPAPVTAATGSATTFETPASRSEVFVTALGDIGLAIASDYALNDVFVMILEGLYRAIGFEHVLLALITPDRTALRGRFGLGEGMTQAVSSFVVKLQPPATPLARAVVEMQELHVTDTAEGRLVSGLPAEFFALVRPKTFLAVPLVIRGSVIGAFYVDRTATQPPIGDTELRDVRVLVNQAVLAVRQARSG